MNSEINEIKIGKQDTRFYLGQCLNKFVYNDEIVLSCFESYKEKAARIAEIYTSVGLAVIDKANILKDKKINWKDRVVKVSDKNTGRIMNIKLYSFILIKNPEFFQFTKKNEREEIIDVETD